MHKLSMPNIAIADKEFSLFLPAEKSSAHRGHGRSF